jgi:FkbM family methyltransferase
MKVQTNLVELRKLKHKGLEFLVRQGTTDDYVVREVLGGVYDKLKISDDDVVLDIGLNIGVFTVHALGKGAKKVYSFEPEQDNFNIAAKNIKLNNFEESRYQLFNSAVVGNNDKHRSFSLNTKKNKGGHSLVHKRGRGTVNVHCMNINEIIATHKPTVIKMDIEGGEYECLKSVKSFECVREMQLEFHHAHLNDTKTHQKYNEIIALLRTHFKEVTGREPKGSWVTNVYCKK